MQIFVLFSNNLIVVLLTFTNFLLQKLYHFDKLIFSSYINPPFSRLTR